MTPTFPPHAGSPSAGQCAVWLYEHHMIKARPAIAGAWLRRARRALEDNEHSAAFGLVHNSTLRDDMYDPTANGTALVGRRTKRKFTLGQKIVVNVERVDRFKRQIDFRVAG